MINPQWLELPISRINFCGPEDVWVIEVRLYLKVIKKKRNKNLILYESDVTKMDRPEIQR